MKKKRLKEILRNETFSGKDKSDTADIENQKSQYEKDQDPPDEETKSKKFDFIINKESERMDTHAEEIQDTLNLLMDSWQIQNKEEPLNKTRDS